MNTDTQLLIYREYKELAIEYGDEVIPFTGNWENQLMAYYDAENTPEPDYSDLY